MKPLKSSASIIVVALMVTLVLAAKRPANDNEIVVPDIEEEEYSGEQNPDDPVKDPDDFEWDSLGFEDCGSTTDLRVVQISSCNSSSKPCQIPIGVPIDVTAEFGSRGLDVSHMRHEASWYLLSAHNRVPVSPDRCEGVDCPFEGPDGLAFTATVTVPANFPPFSGLLDWKVYDEDNNTLICFKVPIQLFNPPTST